MRTRVVLGSELLTRAPAAQVWEQCFDRLQETAVAERDAAMSTQPSEAPAAQQPDAASKRASAPDAAAAVRTASREE
jgi:hypothetical protein